MNYCDYAILKTTPNEHLECTVTQSNCAFQRWCTSQGCIKHTDNFTKCVARRKNVEELKEKMVKSADSSPKAKKETSTKKKYLVVLTCPKYTIYVGEDDNNVEIRGNYNVKIGDYITI